MVLVATIVYYRKTRWEHQTSQRGLQSHLWDKRSFLIKTNHSSTSISSTRGCCGQVLYFEGGKPPLFSGFQEQKSAFIAGCLPDISIFLHQQLFSNFHGITRAAATQRLAAILEVFNSCAAVAIGRWWCLWTWDMAVDVFKPKPEDWTLLDLTGPHWVWVGSNLNYSRSWVWAKFRLDLRGHEKTWKSDENNNNNVYAAS